MRNAFIVAVLVVLTVLGTSVGWLIFGETRTSEAAHFEESVRMVHHQTERMSSTLVESGTVVRDDVSAVTDITELLNLWTPRYREATAAYKRFDAAIVLAEGQAQAYFESQRALTERYHDSAKKAQAQAHDDADYELYSQWRDRAHRARGNAKNILKRLDDVDIDLQKLKLSTEFSFDAGGFQDVPIEITNLEAELAEFQTASDNIREITASPFATGS